MTHITCRLTAKNRDQLRNPTLGNRVWATFTFTFCGFAQIWYSRRGRSSSRLGASSRQPLRAQDFLIDSPLASDWPADDDRQPTGHTQPGPPVRGPGAYCGAHSVVVMSLFKLLTLVRTPVRAYCAPIATRALRSVVMRPYCYTRPVAWSPMRPIAICHTNGVVMRPISTRSVVLRGLVRHATFNTPRAYCGPEADAIFYCIRPT